MHYFLLVKLFTHLINPICFYWLNNLNAKSTFLHLKSYLITLIFKQNQIDQK